MLSESLIEEYERQDDDNQSTKEVHVSLIKNKSYGGSSNELISLPSC